ncbi:glycosyltransferase family 4 protein [Sanguibacter suaedae]|uniref:D-inositol 3-phosphate glycosyltransferase n=1 Tax=Sanguibacter suaedae TaxID=2795737 RepID=A0A934IB90_9MICO|nr:glycosyltransferase family 4 protein [Sanguibacter suaedae]MBI9114758.1 glycosyltransferase family 4 protein [Sanguibacter suaedae]
MTRVLLVSRIFAPEAAAASFRLRALTRALDAAGARVTVLTSRTPLGDDAGTPDGVPVRRWPVLRDADGYVRGYVPYLTFDVPAFFRVLLARGVDVVVCEPPPTTGTAVRVACALRRIPYVYYAADVWSDAAGTTGAPAVVLRVLRAVERWVWRGAAGVLSVSAGVTGRLAELGVTDRVHEVGNGIDTDAFALEGDVACLPDADGPYLVYAGTASEWHGAGVLARAMTTVHEVRPDARLVFIGQGAEKAAIAAECASLPDGVVRFLPQAPPQDVARWLRGAVASLASVRPGRGYDFSFPTKVYASVACGTPAVYAGVGPARDLLRDHDLGHAVDYDAQEVAAAVLEVLDRAARETPQDVADRRARLGAWAREHASLASVGARAADVVLRAARESRPATRRGPATRDG